MKIAVIFGTRPEIIKLSPVIRELTARKADFFIVHTNQHYSYTMDQIFLTELKLPRPKYNLHLNQIKNHGEMVGKMLIEIEKILLTEKPDLVIVQGDTNTTLAGALTASKLGIKLAHIEAGLRSYDKSMPEEINRLVTDHLSDYLFAPTENQKNILLKEGIDKNKIFVVGNTIVDAVWQNLALAQKSKKIIQYPPQSYFLLTLHRPANVDDKKTLLTILKTLIKVTELYQTPIVFPVHPRTEANLAKFKLKIDQRKILLIKPVSYLNMLWLEKNSRLILTDSGGLQEEACILKIPCITLRDNTERPETIAVGANVLVGRQPARILAGVAASLKKTRNWPNPFGQIGVSQKIIKLVF